MYYRAGDIELDNSTHSVLNKGTVVNLTPLEFALLEYLMCHPDKLCSRDEILDNVWGHRFLYDTGTVDVHLNAIRRKLSLQRNYPIETIRGEGLILHTEISNRQYILTILPFVEEWLQSHIGEFKNKGLVPHMQLDPFVSEITMSPKKLRNMLDGILNAMLPFAQPGTICVISHLSLTHFSLLLDINGIVNELRIPIIK